MSILHVLDAAYFSREQMEFPHYVAGLGNGEITALFLENVTSLKNDLSETVSTMPEATMEENIREYERICGELGVRVRTIKSAGIPEEVTYTISCFHDLLLLSPFISFRSVDKVLPTTFTEEVLARSQCPVLVMPAHMQPITEVIHTYDGSFASVYAIRQLARLFPALYDKPVTVLCAPEGTTEGIPHRQELEHYLSHYYRQVTFEILHGKASDVIPEYLAQHRNCIVTFGAYGRSNFSRLFRKSRVDDVLAGMDIPVFVTHPG